MRKLMLAATALTAVASTSMAVDVKLYGLVNKAYMYHDDGETGESTIVDNNLESTRFGFGGEQKLDNGLTAGVLFEVDMQSNPSNVITQNGTGTFNSQANTPTNGSSPSLNERMARVSLGGDFGTVLLGQQDLATDDAPYHDLAAASSVMNANVAAFGGGLIFQNQTGATFANATAGGVNLTPSVMAMGQDGALDAADSIRYNSPVFMGFNGSLSVAQGGTIDGTLRYAGEIAGLQVDSALGHKWINNNTTTATNELVGQTLASVSAKHASGIGATLAYQGRSLDNESVGVDEGQGWYGKVGYNWDAYGVAVDYAKFEDSVATATNNEMDVMGVGADYNMGNGVTVGAAYRKYDLDVAGLSGEQDIDVGVVTMKVKF